MYYSTIAIVWMGGFMIFPDAGAPPTSIGGYIEDMLNELADLADRLKDAPLTESIRQASVAAARMNAKAWAEKNAR